MSPNDTSFPVYATCINTLNTLKGFSLSQYKHVDMHCIHRRKTLPMRHSAPNVKLYRIFAMKIRHPIAIFSERKLGENSVFVLWCTWGKALPNFHHENKEKCCQIFAVEIWHRFQTHWESIDWDHTHSKIKPQSPTCLKPKLMPTAYFQLSMSKNYNFTKKNDCPWTGAMGCLTPSPHVTRLSNSRIKIFYPSILD